MSERTLVISDIHGHYDYLRAVDKKYGDSVDQYIFNGDLIAGGPQPAEVMHYVRQLGDQALVLYGNNELKYMMAIDGNNGSEKIALRRQCTRLFSRAALAGFCASYHVQSSSQRVSLQHIEVAMKERGDWDVLEQAKMYYEAPDYITIHAGLTNESWSLQQKHLAKAQADITQKNYVFPIQIMDDAKKSLSTSQRPFSATQKTVITGHAHNIQGDPVTAHGKRVRLATRLQDGAPLRVWESWNQRIQEITPE